MFDREIDAKVKAWIEENRQEIIDLWLELARIPSVVSEPEEGAPYGKDAKKALDYCADMFAKYGFPTRIGEDTYALSTYGEGKKSIGLFGHADVVPGGDGWIHTAPFEPVIIEDTMIGRGVSDDKSGIMLALGVLRMFKELSLPLKSKLISVVGSAEEVGSPDMAAFVKNEPLPDFSVTPDAGFPCAVGEKGIYRFYVSPEKPFECIKSFFGGDAINVVVDKTVIELDKLDGLVSELQSKLKNRTDITLTESTDSVTLTARGISAHVSAPQNGVNSNKLIAELLKGVHALSDSDREGFAAMDKLLSDHTGEIFGINFSDPTFGALTIGNGTGKMAGGNIELGFNVRYGVGETGEWLEKQTEKAFASFGWPVVRSDNRPAFVLDGSCTLPLDLAALYNEMTGKNSKPYTMGGKTYATPLNLAGDCTQAIGIGTCIGTPASDGKAGLEMPKGHGGAHAPDEKIWIPGFFDAMHLLVQYVLTIDEYLNR